ncbi:MAG: hypothetical protein J6K29_02725, partial [Clostridia bacterium]|nr:hypothetical protein [Clostridia bacterium]
ISLAGLEGENSIRVLYKNAEGAEACLSEFTVTLPEKPKDITNTFTSDFASQTVDTPINSTDLAGAFTPMLNLGDYKTLANGYKLDGISELFADVNGKYALTVNFAEGRNGNYYAFARGVHAVETNATEGVNFTIKNFYETDGTSADMGGAGIYARIEGTDLKIMIKVYDGESNVRVKNVYYTLPCTGTTLTLADDGETVYILVDGVTYATVAMSGETEYDGFANVSPATTFAKTAVVTLIDGTTETLTDTLIDSTCDTQTGLVVRSGSFVFDVLNLTAFSAVEIPEFETPDEPEIIGVPGQFTMEKTVFASDEPIMATASAGTHAWLEFYYESEGSYTGFDWCYVGDGGSAVDEPFDLRNVVYSAGAAYSFTAGKYKIAWFPTDDRANEVVIEFEIQ